MSSIRGPDTKGVIASAGFGSIAFAGGRAQAVRDFAETVIAVAAPTLFQGQEHNAADDGGEERTVILFQREANLKMLTSREPLKRFFIRENTHRRTRRSQRIDTHAAEQFSIDANTHRSRTRHFSAVQPRPDCGSMQVLVIP